MIVKISNLRINYKARDWCKLPYPNHPLGCPNFGKRETCPPDAPLVENFFDFTRGLYLIIVKFDLEAHVLKMRREHQWWSDRQARCCLYWQARVNKSLANECELFRWAHPDMLTTQCPEAMGVNVIATAQLAGIPISVKPLKVVYKVALAGKKPIATKQSSAKTGGGF